MLPLMLTIVKLAAEACSHVAKPSQQSESTAKLCLSAAMDLVIQG